MDVGACWQPGVWANGSWVEGAWCPNEVCTPESIGECWAVSWCSGAWVTGAWCPTEPTPTPTAEEIHLLEPFYVWDERKMLRRKEEEIVIL